MKMVEVHHVSRPEAHERAIALIQKLRPLGCFADEDGIWGELDFLMICLKPIGEGELQDDDFRPTKFHLSNGEIRAMGVLCGGAVANIARELLEIRAELSRLRSQERPR